MNEHIARRIANRVNRDYGEQVVTPGQVMAIYHGDTPVNEAIVSRVLQEIEEYGF